MSKKKEWFKERIIIFVGACFFYKYNSTCTMKNCIIFLNKNANIDRFLSSCKKSVLKELYIEIFLKNIYADVRC